jgi:hypothetical protein
MKTVAYYVGDILRPVPSSDPNVPTVADFAPLMAALESAKAGIPSDKVTLIPVEPQLVLIVSGNGVVHRRVQAVIEELRKHPLRVTTVGGPWPPEPITKKQ